MSDLRLGQLGQAEQFASDSDAGDFIVGAVGVAQASQVGV
jgi:hypothetical protein